MHVDKNQIVQLLRDRGEHEKADQAQAELPDKVDHDQHGGLLDRLGVDAKLRCISVRTCARTASSSEASFEISVMSRLRYRSYRLNKRPALWPPIP